MPRPTFLPDDNASAWLDEAPPYEPGPALARDLVADVAVIGGGLTGVSTALQISRRFPERRVVLFEARALAHGASGRNGGQVLNGINGVSLATIEEEARIYRTTCAGIDLIEEYARLAPDAGFARNGCVSIYTDSRRAEAAHAEVERWREGGLPLRWLSSAEMHLHGAHGGVLDPRAGRVNGLALVRGLRPRLIAQGVEVFEQTPVIRVEEGREVRLTTAGGEVRAAAVVLATNVYSAALGYFRREILPLQSHVLATGPLAAEQWRQLGWGDYDAFSDDLDRVAYGCRTAGGRMIFGGGSNASYDYHYGGGVPYRGSAARLKTASRQVKESLAGYLPGLAATPVSRRWTGVIDLSLDRSCSIGVRGEHRNVYYAIGYSGHGVALSALAGKVICDLYSDHHEPWRDLPFYQRRLLPMPPDPLRWLGYHVYTRLTGRSPRR